MRTHTVAGMVACVILALGPRQGLSQAPSEDLLGTAGRDLTPLVRALNAPQHAPTRARGETGDTPAGAKDGRARFTAFVAGAQRALEAHPELAKQVGAPASEWDPELRDLLVAGYVARGLGAEAWAMAGELVTQDTAAGNDGALAAEQWRTVADHLSSLAESWGLRATGNKGEVLAISVGKGRRAAALVAAVVDTPPAPGGQSAPPGVAGSGALQGVGVATKAGLVAALYALRGLHDSGLRLPGPARLLVGRRGQGAAWRGAKLLRRGGPKRADFFTGGPFPAVNAENGVAVLEVAAPPDPPDSGAVEGAPGFRVLRVDGQAGACRSGGCEASALLHPRTVSQRAAVALARRGLRLYSERHPGVSARVDRDAEPLLRVSVRCDGAAGHSPCDALGAVLTFVNQELGAFPDARGRLLRLVADRVLGSPDGSGLNARLEHASMSGSAVRLLSWAEADDGSATARIELSWPPGRSAAQTLRAAKGAVQAFASAEGGPLTVVGSGADPHDLPVSDPTLRVLLGAYAAQTRKPGAAAGSRAPSAAKGWGPALLFGPLPAQPTDPSAAPRAVTRLSREAFIAALRVYSAAWLRLLDRSGRR